MGLNPVLWSQAQDLLLKLVYILKPLADPAAPVPSLLNQRFYIPPKNEESHPFQHAVRILSTLHSVQKQVEEWIGQEPVTEAPQPSKTAVPLPKQAQKLILQVQDAITKLCSSTNMRNPEETPLRQSLKYLKPGLDRIIQAVTQDGMHSASDSLPQPFRFPLPQSSRQELIRKLISFPEHKIKEDPKSSLEKIAEMRERGGEAHPQKPQPLVKAIATLIKQEGDIPLPPKTERTSIPAAPFTPETRSLSPTRKKKKRKGFWFRDKEEEERDNS